MVCETRERPIYLIVSAVKPLPECEGRMRERLEGRVDTEGTMEVLSIGRNMAFYFKGLAIPISDDLQRKVIVIPIVVQGDLKVY